MNYKLMAVVPETPIPENSEIFRFVTLRSDGEFSTAFEPSSSDKKDNPPSVSVWICGVSEPQATLQFVKRDYSGYFIISAFFIRQVTIKFKINSDPLDILHLPLSESPPGSGHAGITGLIRPENKPRDIYKTLRVKLADEGRKQYIPF